MVSAVGIHLPHCDTPRHGWRGDVAPSPRTHVLSVAISVTPQKRCNCSGQKKKWKCEEKCVQRNPLTFKARSHNSPQARPR
jgi:hypothetical protein